MWFMSTLNGKLFNKETKMTEYADFRQRLDAVLRTLDVKRVSEFLIIEKQWSPGKPTDVEFAMWMVAIQCDPLYTLSRITHFCA
jgi:hypothetical protein